MLSEQEKLEIFRRLEKDKETELSRDDLDRMLDEELARPEGQADKELIQEIMLLLEAEPEQDAAAEPLTAAKPEKRASVPLKWAARIAAALVIALGLMLATYKTAEAFNWQLLMRLMRPVAETFLLYSGTEPEAPVITDNQYAEREKITEDEQYASLQEAPIRLRGYPIRPAGIPERFTYLQGSAYSDDLNTSITHVYMGDDGMCIFTVLVLHDGQQTSSQLYERTLEEPREMYIAGCRVYFYINSDDATMSASWVSEAAQYGVFGVISEEELKEIVESTMNQ